MGLAQSTEPSGQLQGEAAVLRPFVWNGSILLPQRELGSGDWRSWVAPQEAKKTLGRSRARGIPGATVEVLDRFLDERQAKVLEFNAAWAPILARSFQTGWQNSYTGQMLAEFMTMTAGDLRPPSIPAVWYNGLTPYWVQQGWGSALGMNVSATSSPKPMILYPGKR